MEALNEKERSMALLKFLGVFLVTIILVNAAIWTNYQVPGKERDMLKAENVILKNTQKGTQQVLLTIDSIRAQLERYENNNNKTLAEMDINANIALLGKYARQDSSDFGNIIARVGDAFSNHLIDKKKVINSGNSSSKIAELDKAIAELKAKYKECDDELLKKGLLLKEYTR